MLRHHLFVLVLAAVVCCGASWRVFPLPDQPAASSSTSKYTAPRVTVPAKVPSITIDGGAPTKATTTSGFKPASPVSNKAVKEPAKDLLPPKEDLPV